MGSLRPRQWLALAILVMLGSGLALATARTAGLVFGAGSSVAPEAPADLGLPSELALPAVEWVDPGELSPVLQDGVAQAYESAWLELAGAQATGRIDRLDRYFTGPALDFARSQTAGTVFVTETGFHRLQAGYLHPEEWLVELTDLDLEVARAVEEERLGTVETYRVVMVIERGRWMVYSMVRVIES